MKTSLVNIFKSTIIMYMTGAVIVQIHRLLLKKKKTVSAAESCTGGMLSEFLTSLPGSSKYFILGVVSYSNKAKEDILKIPSSMIARHGAVSTIVAQLMARSVRILGRTDLGIGVTGIAGPAGGSKEKPVGTVFIAIDSKNKKICEKFIFSGGRSSIRKQTALKALELLKNLI
ncbi:MAG: CinA family protein [Candidatus Omnitrophica bacterium]|nr:CinA family protein [Candidatus Omnitrophota bacterium]MDD5553995.1 CinA family protein [Candidatus Omnitrophota bacterium]